MTGDKKLRDITFQIEEMPGCCGIGVVCCFDEEEAFRWTNWGERKHPVPGKYETPEEQAEACYKSILNKTWGKGAIPDDWADGTEYSTLQISLVSKYRNDGPPQFPALQTLLKRKQWRTLSFINPNHGNQVTLFTKHFPRRKELYEE